MMFNYSLSYKTEKHKHLQNNDIALLSSWSEDEKTVQSTS